MIKVSVLYPYEEGKTFDMAYYCDVHFPLVQRLLGAACKKVEVEQGIAGGAPGSSPLYVAMGHMFFEKIEDFATALHPHEKEIMGDIPNFTDIAPVLQISEVKI